MPGRVRLALVIMSLSVLVLLLTNRLVYREERA